VADVGQQARQKRDITMGLFWDKPTKAPSTPLMPRKEDPDLTAARRLRQQLEREPPPDPLSIDAEDIRRLQGLLERLNARTDGQ